MTTNIYGFELDKIGKELHVNSPHTDWEVFFNIETELGHIDGQNEDDMPGDPARVHFKSLEDVDQMLKMLKLLRVMIETQRGDGAEKPDDFY